MRRLPKMLAYPYQRTGPGTCACQTCGWVGSTNALGRASHERGRQHLEAVSRLMAERAAKASETPDNERSPE
jgi:hypothetical protein